MGRAVVRAVGLRTRSKFMCRQRLVLPYCSTCSSGLLLWSLSCAMTRAGSWITQAGHCCNCMEVFGPEHGQACSRSVLRAVLPRLVHLLSVSVEPLCVEQVQLWLGCASRMRWYTRADWMAQAGPCCSYCSKAD